jgi:hypothetical protein
MARRSSILLAVGTVAVVLAIAARMTRGPSDPAIDREAVPPRPGLSATAAVPGTADVTAAERSADAPPAIPPAPAGPVPAAAASAAPVPPPSGLEEFSRWSEERRLDAVSRLQHDRSLPAATIAFLRAELRDRSHWLVTRNNIANALLNQDPPDPTLAETFGAMIDDAAESPEWREYAIQHLAVGAATAADPQAVIERLRALLRDGDRFYAGTVMVHLDLLEQRGLVHLGDDFTADLARHLRDPRSNIRTRIAALGLLGERHAIAELPMVRSYAAAGGPPSLQRTAIAALGLLGDEQDAAMIAARVADQDPAIAQAAAGALRRIEQRRP